MKKNTAVGASIFFAGAFSTAGTQLASFQHLDGRGVCIVLVTGLGAGFVALAGFYQKYLEPDHTNDSPGVKIRS